jgi:hypothetical protein
LAGGFGYILVAEPSLNFPMMDWTESSVFSNVLEGGVCTSKRLLPQDASAYARFEFHQNA